MEIKRSTIKLQEFNNCDPAQVIEVLANTHALPVDLPRDYWQNDTETLVIKLPLRDVKDAVSSAICLASLLSDEYDYVFLKDDKGNDIAVLRLWWD